MRKIQLAVTAGLTAFVLAVAPVATAQPIDPAETPTASPAEDTPTLTPTVDATPTPDLDPAETPVTPEIPTPTPEEIAELEEAGMDFLEPDEIAELADTPVEARYQRVMDEYFGQAADGVTTPEATDEAEALLAQALAGDLVFQGSQPEVNGHTFIDREGFYAFVQRGPKAELDYMFAVIDAYGVDPSGMFGSYLGPEYGHAYGSAIAVDGESVYYAFALFQ